MRSIRARLSYANVMATVAVFIALGGTSYAVVSLPKNSVGSRQIRTGAVGASDLHTGAVRSRAVRNGSLTIHDLSGSARDRLRGQTGPAGPPGPTYHVAVSSTGGKAAGNATSTTPVGVGRVAVTFSRDVTGCQAVATLTTVPGDPVADPPAGRATVVPRGSGIEVRTYDVNGMPRDLPVNVVVAC